MAPIVLRAILTQLNKSKMTSRGMMPRNQALPPSLQGLAATFDVLAKTHNEAAVDLLLAALDDADQAIREAALSALLKRRTLRGHREIIARLASMDGRRREIVRENPRFLGRALREAIQSADSKQCAIGCSTVLWLHEYDLMPALAHEAENASNPNQQLAAQHVLELAEQLYQELALPAARGGARDAKLTRQHVLHNLERSLGRFTQHKRSEIVEAFLLLAQRDNAALRRILADPMHEVYLGVVDQLTFSPRGGIIRLVLSFLDDPQAPSAAIAILGRRNDAKFLGHLLRKIGDHPAPVAIGNLRRMDQIAWLETPGLVLAQCDDEAQAGAVQLATHSGISRAAAFKLISYLVKAGKLYSRRAAVAALTTFRGAEANELAVEAAKDPDPQVQALALAQLRLRGVPGRSPCY